MGNTLSNLIQTKVVPGLYKQYFQDSTTSWMENNAFGVEYTGGKYVIMHELTVDGLGDYDRNLGYPRGNIGGAKKQFELTQDRGREFLIDAADNDETGFLVSVANAMSVFQRDHVIPEIDAYRYSEIHALIAAGAPSNIISTAIEADTITQTLIDDIAAVRDAIGNVPLVITMSGLTQKYFGREFQTQLDLINFMRGEIYTKLKGLDGNPIMIAPSARLKTAYDFLDGVSAGEEAGGFVAATGAKDMKWIITPVSGPTAVGKIDKMRAFSPEEYQGAHAWKTDYRLFHDLWMTDKVIKNSLIRTGDITTD